MLGVPVATLFIAGFKFFDKHNNIKANKEYAHVKKANYYQDPTF